MKGTDDLVSIILPTYNRAGTIERAMESVINQTFGNWELIIVDDGSTDDTEEVVSRYQDVRIRYLKQLKNSGANHARNIGIASAKGSYIAFIDSDNTWNEEKLSKQITLMQMAEDDIGLIYSAFVRIDRENRCYIPNRYLSQTDKEDNIMDILFKENIIDTNTVLIKKECFDKVGVFDEEFPRLQDWEMFFRVISVGGYKVKFIEEDLVNNYLLADSISAKGYKYLEARILFLKKYRNLILENDKVDCVVSDILQFPCEEVPINERIEKIRELFEDNLSVFFQSISAALVKEVKNKNKFKSYYELLEQWVLIKQRGKNLQEYFNQHGYKKIAIYGMGNLGKRLMEELYLSDVSISYIVDRVFVVDNKEIKVVHPQDVFENVDVIVVTAVNEYGIIRDELQKKVNFDIISLDEVVREVCINK